MVNLPEFTGKDLSKFAENFGQFLRMTGRTHASGRVKCDLLLQCCKTKYPKKQAKQIVTKSATFADVLVALERQYPTYETDLSIRAEIQNLAVLPNTPKPGRVSEPPPHRGGHARHPAMLLPHPRLPPANTPARPGADMATPRVTHVPAQPRQRRHTSTSTHGSPGKTRAHARCPNPHPRSRYLQDPAS